jgi:hypothetical protein
MVSGKVTKLGRTFKLDLQLFNNARAKVDNAVSQSDIADDKGLVEAAKVLARRAVAPILEKNSGQLFVAITDQGAAGAAIDIDDKTAGITVPPGVQAAPIVLGWGPHHVRVKKEGFLTFEKDVQIDEGQSTTLVVTLVPSPDFIDAYKSRNSKLRIGTYVAAAVAVVAGAYAVQQNMDNIQLYKAYESVRHDRENPGGALPSYYTANGCSILQGKTGAATFDDAYSKSYNQGSSQLTRIGISAGVGVAAAATAVTLFILTDDPHRYDGFIQATPGPAEGATAATETQRKLVPTLGLSPLPGGAFASAGLQF